MKKIFKVGGHKFALVMPDSNQMWKQMMAYAPFVSEDESDVLFTVEMVAALPDTSGKKQMHVSCESPTAPRIVIYDWNGQWLLETSPVSTAPVSLRFVTDKAFKKAQFVALNDKEFSHSMVLMLMYTFATAQKNTLMMHSSVTVNDGKAYMFLGKSGTGKSTHSQLWINNIEGCELLNDDNPVVKVEDNGEVRVYGTPWSGKTPCYRNLNYPVGAIVDLHQAKTNMIHRLPLVLAYKALYVSASGYHFIKDMADGLHATEEKVVMKVPFYSLDCLPNAEAAYLCHNTVTR